MNLLPQMEDAVRLLLLDAIKAGRAPGTQVELVDDAIPRLFATKLSPHEIDLREVLALAELRGTLPAQVVALGAEPERVELGTELSPAVAAAVPHLVERAVAQLVRWGHRAGRVLPRP
jgi:hydrogenase maturation protease